jgi:hypothetical protein
MRTAYEPEARAAAPLLAFFRRPTGYRLDGYADQCQGQLVDFLKELFEASVFGDP